MPTLGLPVSVECADGYYLYVLGFDSDGAYLGRTNGCTNGWVTSCVADFDGASCLMLVVRKATNSAISPSEVADAHVAVTLAGGGGSMTDTLSREEAYAANGMGGWQSFAQGSPPTYASGRFRNAGAGNGVRTWGLSEGSLPMGATGYMSIDTSPETCTNPDNTIAQDSVPLTTGDVYTIGAFVRGRGCFSCGPTQDGYYRAVKVYVDHPQWRFYGGEFSAKSGAQSMYWRNETVSTDQYAGRLDVCAPLLVRGGGWLR